MTTYRGKISTGMIFFLSVLFGYIAFDELYESFDIILLLIIISPLLLIICLFVSIKYMVTKKELVIYGGFFMKQKIDIAQIRKIQPTNSIMSAPAASFDRLEIFYNKFDSVIISPKEKEAFIKKLLEVNPNIEVSTSK